MRPTNQLSDRELFEILSDPNAVSRDDQCLVADETEWSAIESELIEHDRNSR